MASLNTCTTRVSTLPNLPTCQYALTSPFLTLVPPPTHQHHPSLQTSKSGLILSHNNTSSFGSLVKASMAASAESTETTTTKPLSVLFVCLGNICRSPAAEGVFRDIVTKRGLDSNFNIDSAGTIGYHEVFFFFSSSLYICIHGNLADPRMRAASKRRGIEITSLSRPIRASDFKDFDLILAMDKQNRDDIMDAFNRWKFRETLPEDAHKKVKLMCSYCKKHDETEVPDPYYGGPQGFEKVLDLLEDACESLLDSIVAENGSIFNS
ncbi:hypothetical protein EZV62_002247 [Acer yangbiense]|uniref:Phosphotyrosine protein phosphatase I domain-containing protein n=1 Tax=Acer yangbiense TaxID=1000413 RepID=A0A5C7IX28_9ROSI|nr:hypothetical protein EZV62_002247 [Acer yangbiense]